MPIDESQVLQPAVSVAGSGARAPAALSPHGVLAVLNFSGGHGVKPDPRQGDLRASEAMARLLKVLAQREAAPPSLWKKAESLRRSPRP